MRVNIREGYNVCAPKGRKSSAQLTPVSFLLPAFRLRIPRWLDHFFVGSAARMLSLLFGMIAARPGIIFCIAHTNSSHRPASAAVSGEKSFFR
jgi:hypothetical protein